MLSLKEAIDQLAMVSSVRWYGHVLRIEDGHVLRGELDFKVEGQGKRGRPKRIWKNPVDEKCVEVGLSREDALC